MKNQGSSVTAIKHGSTLFRDEPFSLRSPHSLAAGFLSVRR
ncbi:hypothetical protein L573_0955 [Bordetella holmesii H620]|nr:hypothetical protein L573_0955 [Bordetella holmesii H620]KCV07851.1 hypothetical protein L498_0972 [Bordetella holmesii CDC-H629-BH]